MLYDKEALLVVIDTEIIERDNSMDGDGMVEYDGEIKALNDLRSKVLNEQPLEFNEYNWLCDLVSVDSEVRLDN